jgi:secretion/DNA translocation related TadE-like protein
MTGSGVPAPTAHRAHGVRAREHVLPDRGGATRERGRAARGRGSAIPDRGSATVLLLGLLALGCVLVLGLARLGGAAVTRARADTAAEVGALAAADQVALGRSAGAACAVAGATVGRNGARLVSCIATSGGVSIRVVREGHGLITRGHARAEIDARCARAPVTCPPDTAQSFVVAR